MDDDAFDAAVVKAAFDMAAGEGWRGMTVAEAARAAGLDLPRVRTRFPSQGALLLRFGAMADRNALGIADEEADPRERLFDMVMRRFDTLQQHRDGVLALMQALPADPGLSLLLYGATLRSMNWLLGGAGVPASGLGGALRTHGLLAVWLSALRAWQRDDSTELSGVMAALDKGLTRAVEAERWLPGRRTPADTAADAFTPTSDEELAQELAAEGSAVEDSGAEPAV